jgi:uncharacterized membrane protein
MDQHSEIKTLSDLRKEFDSVSDVRAHHRKTLSPLDGLAVFVTERIGTMGFFLVIFTWTILWLGWNILAPDSLRFDPFPAFAFWLFISNLIQLHLLPLIMVGQNIQSRHAEMRSEYDYQTDRKAEKEIETILLHLEKQQTMMLEILKRLEKLEEK